MGYNPLTTGQDIPWPLSMETFFLGTLIALLLRPWCFMVMSGSRRTRTVVCGWRGLGRGPEFAHWIKCQCRHPLPAWGTLYFRWLLGTPVSSPVLDPTSETGCSVASHLLIGHFGNLVVTCACYLGVECFLWRWTGNPWQVKLLRCTLP